ncbi:site-specific integrase [Pelagibacteraceae bacterium]|nr:site-specific integrase [Pelagibacteraceae bacterium]
MATISKHYGKWQAQIRIKDYPNQTKSFLLKKDAELWARQTEILLQKNDLGIRLQSYPTFIEIINRYIKEVSSLKRGYVNERHHLSNILKEKFIYLLLNKITPLYFAQYRDKRLREIKSSTFLREFNILSHIFTVYMTEWDYEIINPLKKIKKPKANDRRERRLTEYEYNFLVKGNYPQQTLRYIIEFAIEMGMRRGEILNIKQEHIKGQTLLIPQTKNGHPRTIPLTRRALYILNNTELPFTYTPNALKLAWNRLKKKGNIKDLHFHDLRYEAISRFFEKGLTIPEVALISGHKDVRMLFRYTHLKAEDILRKL